MQKRTLISVAFVLVVALFSACSDGSNPSVIVDPPPPPGPPPNPEGLTITSKKARQRVAAIEKAKQEHNAFVAGLYKAMSSDESENRHARLLRRFDLANSKALNELEVSYRALEALATQAEHMKGPKRCVTTSCATGGLLPDCHQAMHSLLEANAVVEKAQSRLAKIVSNALPKEGDPEALGDTTITQAEKSAASVSGQTAELTKLINHALYIIEKVGVNMDYEPLLPRYGRETRETLQDIGTEFVVASLDIPLTQADGTPLFDSYKGRKLLLADYNPETPASLTLEYESDDGRGGNLKFEHWTQLQYDLVYDKDDSEFLYDKEGLILEVKYDCNSLDAWRLARLEIAIEPNRDFRLSGYVSVKLPPSAGSQDDDDSLVHHLDLQATHEMCDPIEIVEHENPEAITVSFNCSHENMTLNGEAYLPVTIEQVLASGHTLPDGSVEPSTKKRKDARTYWRPATKPLGPSSPLVTPCGRGTCGSSG